MDDYNGFNWNNYGDGYDSLYGCGIDGCLNGNGWSAFVDGNGYEYETGETDFQEIELYK